MSHGLERRLDGSSFRSLFRFLERVLEELELEALLDVSKSRLSGRVARDRTSPRGVLRGFRSISFLHIIEI